MGSLKAAFSHLYSRPCTRLIAYLASRPFVQMTWQTADWHKMERLDLFRFPKASVRLWVVVIRGQDVEMTPYTAIW